MKRTVFGLVAAVFLAVASVGTVGFFADRVKAGLAQQANLLLGADLMIRRAFPSALWVRQALTITHRWR